MLPLKILRISRFDCNEYHLQKRELGRGPSEEELAHKVAQRECRRNKRGHLGRFTGINIGTNGSLLSVRVPEDGTEIRASRSYANAPTSGIL